MDVKYSAREREDRKSMKARFRWFAFAFAFGTSVPLVAYVFAVSTPVAKEAVPKEPVVEKEAVNPAVNKKKLKVYVDNNKTVFWPIDLPFYVRLASAPEDGQESFLLQKATLKSTKDTKELVNQGVKLEIAGSQFIRWMNHVSKDEIAYRFVSDGAPPVTNLKFSQAPRYDTGDKIFFGKGLVAEVIAKDEHAGVQETFFSLDKIPFASYKSALRIDTEKTFSLAHYAVDNVGYVSPTLATEFTVDLSPPHSTVSTKNNFQGTVLSSATRIMVSSLDNLSGVKTIFYKFNNQPDFQVYQADKGIDTAGLTDGTQILKYYAEDQVANREPTQEFQFYLDLAPPSVAYTFSGDSFVDNDKRYISPRTRIKLDASDSQVKVKEILYAVNSNPQQTYASPFTPAVNQGEVVLQYQAKDDLDNISPPVKAPIIMDSEPPHTKHTIKGKTYVKEAGVVYLGAEAQIQLVASDNLSGVKQIEYQLNEVPPTIYTEPLKLPKEGRYLFRYWATDRVSNQETYTPLLFISDTSGPEIVETFSSDPVGNVPGKQGGNLPVFITGTSLSLAARDNASGLAKIEYSMGGDKYQAFTAPILLSGKGQHSIKVKAFDQVGNKSEKIMSFELVDSQWKANAH